MSMIIVSTVATLSIMGTSAAVILYFVSQKFQVYEDPRIDEVENSLQAANCGGFGYGDCFDACDFDAIELRADLGVPRIIDDKCVACGACVTACPKDLIEMRKAFPRYRKVVVACRNQDKGGVARKACDVACIGCGKCVKECRFDAITNEGNLAFIDAD